MRLLTPGIERHDTGGGSTFLHNFERAMQALGYTCAGAPADTIPDPGTYDALIIAGASLVSRALVESAKNAGKPIILRVDNILEDKKNRNGGMPKMQEYAAAADLIIYQSQWAKAFLNPILGNRPNTLVIYNGVDTDIFYPPYISHQEQNDRRTFFYSKFSRGEGKNVNVVQQWWREHSLHRTQDLLLLSGQFADDNFKVNHPFEFHNREAFKYTGIAKTQDAMAETMRQAHAAILPYFSDACSNTILEAQACGLYVLYDQSGGTPEIIYPGMGEPYRMDIFSRKEDLIKRIDEARHAFNPEAFKAKFGLEAMARTYHGALQMLTAPQHDISV